MLKTGKHFEEIVEMLNNFKSEVQTFSALGLSNINKHSENFLKRILNLTYGYELENLNKGKSNYPGLDLGDTGEGIAFQITATKKSEKIDDALITCLKFKHYQTFNQINVFILTNKQSSYKIKTVTQPYFTFSPENIKDFNDLYRDIELLSPSKTKALHDYIKSELQPVIELIKENKSEDENHLLDVDASIQQSKMSKYFVWRSKILLKTENISVPKMHTELNTFLSNSALKNQCLPIFSEALRKSHSNKQILYYQQLKRTHIQNYFYGNAMLLEPSSITIEKADYTDGEISSNLLSEMVMLLTCILFFCKQAHGKFEIEVSITMETNDLVYFQPTNSLVLEHLLNNFILDSPFKMTETVTNVHTSILADLLQQIMHGFLSKRPNVLSHEPYINIKRDGTEFAINNLKEVLGVNNYTNS